MVKPRQYCLRIVSYVPLDQRSCWVKKSVQAVGPSPTASTSGVYTERHLLPVAGFLARCISKPVAMSSVIESYSPPICLSAEIRTALLVPTNMGEP